MHTFTVTVAVARDTTDFDFVTRTVQAGHVYQAIERATSFGGNPLVWLMETEVLGRTTTWFSLDEMDEAWTQVQASGKLPG